MNNKIFPDNQKNHHLVKNPVCVGIDLGTTYSLMAVVDSCEVDFTRSNHIPVKFISIPQQSPFEWDSVIYDEKVASIVALYNGKPYVGNNLYHLKGRKGFTFKKNMFYHWKVELGIEHFPMYPDAISEKLDMPYKIAAGILRYMGMHYLKPGDKKLGNTIVTVPASFQINQREDVLKACQLAGIETSKNMLIDEPNAAFLGYFNQLDEQEKQQWAKNVRNKNILVIDFGGGTLDLSILNVDFRKDRGITIANCSISRYNDLGGQDIDVLIAEKLLYPLLKEKFPVFDTVSQVDLQNIILPQLSVVGEKLKIDISDALSLKAAEKDVMSIDYQNIKVVVDDSKIEFKGKEYDLGAVSISGRQFDEVFTQIFGGQYFNFKYQDKSVTTVSRSISQIIEKSNLSLDEIHYVLYVGGSSFNPFLISKVKEKLTNAQSLVTHNPDKLVTEGAAVYSYFYYVHGVSLIKPITADTIGIVLKGNTFFPLIEKGTQLPFRVKLPEFKLQSNLNSEIVVPVCINGIDYPIGEIRAALDDIFSADKVVTIEAEVTEDKVFDLKIYIGDEFIGEADFENPFSIGKVSSEERELLQLQRKIQKACFKEDKKVEKVLTRRLIKMHSDVNNNAGIVETCERYIKKFDDQDDWVWNMLYLGYSNMGRMDKAEKALRKAMELSPDSASWIYNYSLVIERESTQRALEFLESQKENIKNDSTVQCKMVLLKNELSRDCKAEALAITENYKNASWRFSDFDKRVLLPDVFHIAEKPFSYVDPQKNRRKEDEKKYLVNKGSLTKS